jgi:hypothetical protein
MSAVIMIEIVLGIVVLAAAIRFAVRDTMQREANRELEVEPGYASQAPARRSEPETKTAVAPEEAAPEAAQPLSEVGAPEKS